ncbi:dTDP-4-keto-6-deoxy-D-glucose epimerase [Polynucleobacter paneuropaeus]|nr:dTDP-4-keto-6-deoxy-D-glucose epimerase [Polynucleobacter paneuropaeus]
MNLIDTTLAKVKIIEASTLQDERGEFSRIFCDVELNEVLCGKAIKQINRSVTNRVGTIRGLHFQKPPFAEIKIIRCLSGRVFDVVVDLRKNSPTFLQWFGTELSPTNNFAHFIPEGCAHGFQVLEESSELLYLHTAAYAPEFEAAVRFDDPMIGIAWPIVPTEISRRDSSHPYLGKVFEGIIV